MYTFIQYTATILLLTGAVISVNGNVDLANLFLIIAGALFLSTSEIADEED